MPLEIAFYSDALASGHYGLGRYARELFRALGNAAPEIQARPVSALKPDRSETPSHQRATHHTHLSRRSPTKAEHAPLSLPYPRKVMAGLWSTLGLPQLDRWAPWADVVHCVELDYRVATSKPLVVTIHDIGPLTHPEFFRKSHPWLLKIALNSAVARAAAIICVSRATADSVEEYTNCTLGD